MNCKPKLSSLTYLGDCIAFIPDVGVTIEAFSFLTAKTKRESRLCYRVYLNNITSEFIAFNIPKQKR